SLLESMRLLATSSTVLADRCIDGIEADVDRCREYAESSPSVVTPLNRLIGYEDAATIAKKAIAERKTIRQTVIDEGYVSRGDISEADLDNALDLMSMTHPYPRPAPAVHPESQFLRTSVETCGLRQQAEGRPTLTSSW